MNVSKKNSVLTRQITIEDVLYHHMPIEVAIKYADKITSGFFIPLSEVKRVRIQLEDGDISEKMVTYKEKGLKSILLAEKDYFDFIKKIKRGLTRFFLKDDSDDEYKPLGTQQMFILVNRVVKYIGIKDEIVEQSEEVLKSVLQQFKSIAYIYSPLRQFQRENQDEYLKNLMISYTSIGLIEALNWTTPQIKEKIVQICLFSDITLTSENYTEMILMGFDHTIYPEYIQEHPLKAAALVSKTKHAVGREVIQAIKQHHEHPDGTGYPKNIKGLSIDQLSAIQIIARTFITKLVESDFAYEDRKTFITDMLKTFDYPNFAQPCKALYILMGLEPEKQKNEY